MLWVIRKMATACVVCALCVSVGYGDKTPLFKPCYHSGDCVSNCCIASMGGGWCGSCLPTKVCERGNKTQCKNG